jgi:phosphoglycolate phosphatase-like HAD superfamily hydrolase
MLLPATRRLIFTSIASTAVSTVRGFQQQLSKRTHHPFISASTTTTTTSRMASSSSDSLFLFDFDGVVCDSCDECTVSALRTCQKLGVLDDGDDNHDANLEYPPQWLFDKMREIRPAIEVGWQIPVLLSVFLEQQKDNDNNKLSVEEIIANYQELVANWLSKRGKTETDMIDAFGAVRDAWIKEDIQSWLDINTFYPGVPEALENCANSGEAVLVTTKQQRFAISLCRHAGVSDQALPNDKIYGLGQYKAKADVIVDRMTAGGYSPQQTLFFEDRWPTLAKCLKDKRLDGVRLHLCAWGYVAEFELALAKAEPRVEVLSLEDFSKIVKKQSSSA